MDSLFDDDYETHKDKTHETQNSGEAGELICGQKQKDKDR